MIPPGPGKTDTDCCRYSSTARAACLPSLIAQTTSDCPLLQSVKLETKRIRKYKKIKQNYLF